MTRTSKVILEKVKENNIFKNKQNLREFTIIKQALQKMLKGVVFQKQKRDNHLIKANYSVSPARKVKNQY